MWGHGRDNRLQKTKPVNSANVKVGKARNLSVRETNYWNDFGPANVLFTPVAKTARIREAETAVLRELSCFRKLSPKRGRMDWLENIERDEVIKRIFAALKREGIEHVRLL